MGRGSSRNSSGGTPELRRRVAFLTGDVLREREREWNTLRVISDQG